MNKKLAVLILGLVLFSSAILIVQNTLSEAQSPHDLMVTLQAPSKLLLPETGTLNLTVFNLGTSDENNVVIQILISDHIVASKTIPLLRSGSFDTISHLWTPETGGVYNVTGYARPVAGEGNAQNNVVQRDVPVEVRNLVSVEPKSMHTGTIPSTVDLDGRVLDVNVTITNVQDMYSYQFTLEYNSSVLSYVPSEWWKPDHVFDYTINSGRAMSNGSGWVSVGAFLMGVEPTFYGSGTLGHLQFKVIHPGQSYLNLSDVILVNNNVDTMTPVHTSNGTVYAWTMIGNHRVVVEPESHVVLWNGTLDPSQIDMALEGGTYCNLTIPLLAMKGPFEVTVDYSRAGYLVDFNATHAFLRFRYGYTQSIHNARISEGWKSDVNNDCKVDILDIFLVARDFGKKCP